MIVTAYEMTLNFYNTHSLKEKRQILKSLLKKVQNNFNISIAETGANDFIASAMIGFAITGNSQSSNEQYAQKVISYVENNYFSELELVKIEKY